MRAKSLQEEWSGDISGRYSEVQLSGYKESGTALMKRSFFCPLYTTSLFREGSGGAAAALC